MRGAVLSINHGAAKPGKFAAMKSDAQLIRKPSAPVVAELVAPSSILTVSVPGQNSRPMVLNPNIAQQTWNEWRYEK